MIDYTLKNKCRYCHATENLTIDHKHPRSLGGTNEPKNLQTLCAKCNMLKSGIPHKTLLSILRWYEETKKTRVKPWRHLL